MRLKLTTWDSHAINDGTNYEAVIIPGNSMPSATANFIDIGQGDPILTGKTLSGAYFTFHIILRGSIETQRDTLNSWFRPNDFTMRNLVAQDLDNASKEWYLNGFPVTPPMLADSSVAKYSITLALSTPYWLEVTGNTNTWSITADTETEVMTNTGNISALPKFVITPKQAKGSNGLAYKSFYAVYFDHALTYQTGFTNMPYNLTGAGLDTATLVGAGKMQADGDDVGVMVDNVYVDRWFGGGGMNSATTKIWINLSMSPAPTMALSVALPNNGTTPASVVVTYTETYAGYVDKLKNFGSIMIGTEIISYLGLTVDQATSTITFIPSMRAAKNSSYAAHSIGDAVYWIQHDIWLTYGNSTMTARPIDNTKTPGINLTSSTNASWVFDSFKSWGVGLINRAGAILYGNWYTGVHGTDDAALPVAGIYLKSRLVGNTIQQDTVTSLSWYVSHPGHIDLFSAVVSAYRSSTTFGWCNIEDPLSQNVYVHINPPSSVTTWEDTTITNVSTTSGNPTRLALRFEGALGTSSPAPEAYVELTSITIRILTPVLVVAIGVEQENYRLSFLLTNSTTGAAIRTYGLYTKLDSAITIDCATQEVYGVDGKRLRGAISFEGPKRDEWMTLIGGANSIVFLDVGTVEVTIVTTWSSKGTI